jgi:diguanylate cyclase (GGDEF)-like protein
MSDRATGQTTEALHTTQIEKQSQVSAEQVRFIYKQLPSGLYGSLVIGAILILMLWNQGSHYQLISWGCLISIITLGRFVLLSSYNKASPDTKDISLWRNRFIIGAGCAGLAWGLAGYFLMPPASLVHQMFMVFILGGLMAGASQSLAAVMGAYAAFSVPLLLPATIWLFLQNDPIHSAMGFLLLFFVAVLILMARHLNTTLRESLCLRFENIDLVDKLKAEVDQRKRSEEVVHGHNQVLEILATHGSLQEALKAINVMIEKQLPGAISSILLLDEASKHLTTASAPSLPDAYNHAIDGIIIGPKAGACGTAAYRNEMVIVEDITSDPLWDDYRDLALPLGLRSCWSMPIRNYQNKVFGTFGLYHRKPNAPNDDEIELIRSTAHLTGVAIEKKQSEMELKHMAHMDHLTGLPNRALFMDRLNQALTQAQRQEFKFAVLFIDLDRFKIINDNHGHKAGDNVLKEVAKKLRLCVRKMDTVARLGGDEFTIILSEISSAKDVAMIAQKTIDALAEPQQVEGEEYIIGGSIGISLYPKNGEDVDTLLANADTAMYQAKQVGNSYQFIETC